jgi:hypothetical protein
VLYSPRHIIKNSDIYVDSIINLTAKKTDLSEKKREKTKANNGIL